MHRRFNYAPEVHLRTEGSPVHRRFTTHRRFTYAPEVARAQGYHGELGARVA